MQETGKIIEEKGPLAVVLIDKKEKQSCEKCGLCTSGKNGLLYIEAENSIGAKLGEKVKIEIIENQLFVASFFIYGIPLIGFILGIIISSFISKKTFKVIVFLICFICFQLFGLYLAEKLGQKNKPKIIDKI